MPTGAKLARKNAYMAKLIDLVETKPQCLIVTVDHVGSTQMQRIRGALRGKCIVLMGKNTMIRTAIRKRIEVVDEDAQVGLNNLLAAVQGNMGFIFCDAGQMEAAREVLATEVVPAAAKAGTIAPLDVEIPQGPTGLEPSQTSFFQALNIPTKIVKGSIELTSPFKICVAGEKVVLSAQALLGKLGLKPFSYGMKIRDVFQDGCVFDAAVLDINDSVILGKFMGGVANLAAFSREIGVPTEAALPHMMCNAFKNLVAAVVEIDFSAGEQADEIVAILKDPEALAKMQAAAPAAAAAAAPAEAEEEEDMDFDLFG